MIKNLFTCVALLTMMVGTVFSGGDSEATSDEFKTALTVGDLSNPFFYTMSKGAEAKLDELTNNSASLTTLSSDYDLSKQVGQIDNFIAGGVKLLILNAADTQGIAPAVRRAKEAGIVVIAADVGADGGVDATVTSDNYQAGVIPAEFLVDRLNGQGNVVIINGPPVTAVIDRVNGAKDVFSQYPGITILSENQDAGGSREGGLRVMTDLLTAFDKIDAVFAINDPTGIGAELAIKQAGRQDEMFVVGVDGSPDAVVALKQADSIFLATSAQDPYLMTETAVQIGYDIAVRGQYPEQDTILIPVSLVTKDNIDSYVGWDVPE